MCLQRILENAHNEMYITAPQKLQQDFELVCKNAIIFNMPKEKIYKEALRLLLIVREKFQKYMDILIEWKNTEIAMEDFIAKRCAGEEPAKLETPVYEATKPIEPEPPIMTLDNVDLSYQNEPDYSLSTQIKKDQTALKTTTEVKEGGGFDVSEGVERAGKMLRKRKEIDYTKQIVSDSSIAGKNSNKPQFQNYFDAPDPPKRKGAEGIVHIDQNNKVTLNIGMMEPTDSRQSKNLMQSFAVQERKKKSRKSVHTQEQQPPVRQKQVSTLAHDLEDCRDFLEQKARDESGENGMVATTSYYPGPAVFSFDQASLVYERSCLVCGSFGSDEELLTCDLCGESFHPFCVGLQISNLDKDALERLHKGWKCLNCRFCEVCCSASQEYSRIVYCDICDKAYHLLCLKPQLKHIPNVMWRCPQCFQCSSCQSHKFWNGSDQEFEKMNLSKRLSSGGLQSIELKEEGSKSQKESAVDLRRQLELRVIEDYKYSFTQDFTLCYQCGMEKYLKHYCVVCKQNALLKKTKEKDGAGGKYNRSKPPPGAGSSNKEEEEDDKDQKMQVIQCQTCKGWCHVTCTHLPGRFKDKILAQELPFKCLNCLIKNRSLHQIYSEACENYLMINKIVKRHAMLANVCRCILAKYFPKGANGKMKDGIIELFVRDNQDFFDTDSFIHKWLLDLLGSSFVNDPELHDSPVEQEKKEEEEEEEAKEAKEESQYKQTKQKEETEEQLIEKYGTTRLLKRELKRMAKLEPKLRRKQKESQIVAGEGSRLLYSVKGREEGKEIEELLREIEVTKLSEDISKTCGVAPLSNSQILRNIGTETTGAKDFLTDLVLTHDKGEGTLGTMSSILLVASETAQRMKEDKEREITQSPPGKTSKAGGAASTPKSINTQPDQSQLIEETEMMLHQILPKARDIDTDQSCFSMVNDPVYLEQYRESFLPQPRSFYQQFYYTTHYPRPHNTAAASAIKSLAENKDLKKENPGPLPILQRPFSEAPGYYTVLPNNTIDQQSYEHSNGPVPAPVASAAFKRLRKSNVDDIVRHVSGTLDKYIRNQRTNYSFVQNYFLHEYPAVVRIQTKFQRWVVSDLGQKAREVIAAYKNTKQKSAQTNPDQRAKEEIPAAGLENYFIDLPFEFGIQDDKEVPDDHPSQKLKCSLCGRVGNFAMSGRLLPADNGKFIHANCALFSNDVFQIDNGTLINVFQVLKQSKTIKCYYCDKMGATVACFAKRCQHWYHLHCGLEAQMRFLPSKRSFCKSCFRPASKNISSVDLQEIKSQGLQIKKGEYTVEKYKWETWNTERKLVISRHAVQCRSLSDIEECEFNLWRPYVCEKFNRIGNMTVIRLNTQIMKLWGSADVTSPRTDGPASGYVGVKVYCKLRYMQEQSAEEKQEQKQEIEEKKPHRLKRAYMVITNKEEEERVFYHDTIPPFSFQELVQLRSSKTVSETMFRGKYFEAGHFFQNFLKQYSQQHTNFSLTNLVFNPERFYGMETYPIKFWNNCSEDYKFVILRLPSPEIKNMKAAGKLIVDEYGRPVSYSDTPGLAKQQSLLKTGELEHSVLFGKRSNNVKRNLLNLKTGYQFDRAQALNTYFSRIVSVNNKPYEEKEEQKLEINDLKDPEVLLGSWTVKKEQILLAMQGGLLRDNTKTQEQEEDKRHDALVSDATCVLFRVRYLLKKAPFKYLSYDRSLHHPTNALAIVQAQNLRAKQQRKQIENRQNQNAAAKKIGGSKLPLQAASGITAGDREMAQRLKQLDLPIAMKYRNFIQNPKKIAVAPSRIHKNGLFARQTIFAGQIVAEYVGQLVRNIVADQREIMYKAGQGFGDLYFFRLDHEYVVDATFRGGKARYLNHSCEPNCVTKVHLIHHARHILIFAKRMIKIGEEVTFNYCLESESEKLVCHCGAPSCQGRMN